MDLPAAIVASATPRNAPVNPAVFGGRDVARDAVRQKNLTFVTGQRQLLGKSAADSDAASVRRGFRSWFDWIQSRATNEPIAVGILAGPTLKSHPVFLELARQLGRRSVIGLYPAKVQAPRETLPWPWIGLDNCPAGYVLLVCDPTSVFNDWSVSAYLQREVAVWITVEGDDCCISPDLSQPIAGVITLQGPSVNVAEAIDGTAGKAQSTQLEFGQSIEEVFSRLFPPEILSIVRLAREAEDLFNLQEALSADQRNAQNAASSMIAESERANASREQALVAEEAELMVARSEIAAEMKAVIQEIRLAKAATVSEAQAAEHAESAIEKLLQQIEINSEELPRNLITQKERRVWWQKTWIEKLKGVMSRRFAIQLNREPISVALSDFKQTALESFGLKASHVTQSLNQRILDLASTFPAAAALLARLQVEKIHIDSFRIREREPPGGAMKETASAIQWRNSIEASFESFVSTEARGIRMDFERKGLIGRITEARSAVFGIYFLLVLALRPFGLGSSSPPASPQAAQEQSGDILAWISAHGPSLIQIGVLVLIVVAFVINLRTKPRQERAAIAERLETKLEELPSRGAAFLDRTMKDHLALLESMTNETASALEAAVNQRITTVKLERELVQVAPPKSLVQMPSNPTNRALTADGLLQKAAVDLREEVRDLIAKRLA
jgi:hypothetical protein